MSRTGRPPAICFCGKRATFSVLVQRRAHALDGRSTGSGSQSFRYCEEHVDAAFEAAVEVAQQGSRLEAVVDGA